MIAVLNDFINFGKKLTQDLKKYPNLNKSLKVVSKLAYFSATVHSVKQLSEIIKYFLPISNNRSYENLKKCFSKITKFTDISAIILAFSVAIKYLFTYLELGTTIKKNII